MKKSIIASLIALSCSNAYAIDPFTPLSAPAVEGTDMWVLAPGWTATKITDRNTLSAAYPGTFQSTFGNWDMIDTDATGRYVYLPYEVSQGAGLGRYDRNTGNYVTLMGGNNTGIFSSNPATWSATSDDFGAFDPAVRAPSGSVLTAEEWSGNGRIFEVTNPQTATGTGDANVRWLSNIPSVSHEGVRFDSAGRMYFVDENSSGSIYRMTPNTANDLTSGKVEVLTTTAGGYSANSSGTGQTGRIGAGDWVEIVDASGNTLTAADPFDFTSRGGRAAADEVNGTPFGRPEDVVIGNLNGDEVLYFATTSENIVYGVNLTSNNIFEAINSSVTQDGLGNNPVGAGANDATYGLDDPDNLELTYGPNGEIQLWAIEDEHPGDIWMAQDNNGDGIMDLVNLFASLGATNSEPTGFMLDPMTGGFLVNIQHPADGNDSLWSIAPAPVPLPGAVWLMGSGLLAMIGYGRRKKSA